MQCATYISSWDKDRLLEQIGQTRSRWSTYAPFLDWFRSELSAATALPPADVPADVITMESRFALLDLRTGETAHYTLVYPDEEHGDGNRISILSPMGIALLGARVGDVVRWNDDDDYGACKVLYLTYQPESAGREEAVATAP